MAYDGIFTAAMCRELNTYLQRARVDKINQPERDVIVIQLRGFDPKLSESRSYSLLLSANASSARAHLTGYSMENPLKAPNFCMLLRKHLGSARLVEVTQPELERVLVFRFEGKTELFESTERLLIIEIMGRFSNMILTDGSYRIIDALRPSDISFAKRQLLPGFKYELPPSQGKTVPVKDHPHDITSTKRVDKYLLETFLGFSPLCAREIASRAGVGDKSLSELCPSEMAAFFQSFNGFVEAIENGEFCPTVLSSESPEDFYCFDICQYGQTLSKKTLPDCSSAVDEFYADRQRAEHIKRISDDITKLLKTLISRASRKLDAQNGELEDCKKAFVNKRYGDIISSNIYMLHGGERSAVLPDYYADPVEEVEIALDPRLSPAQNAQRYYRLYKKAQSAVNYLEQQIPKTAEEIRYLESIETSLSTAENSSDLSQIRSELEEQGYYKQKKQKKPQKRAPVRFTEFVSSDGFTVLIGKNNTQNDELTLRVAEKNDIWFHVKNYPGSHVVVVSENKKVPDTTLTEAAIAAAVFSSVAGSGGVEVDYTEIRHVKKPAGAKPGMVVYDPYKTAFVRPDKQLINELIVKK